MRQCKIILSLLNISFIIVHFALGYTITVVTQVYVLFGSNRGDREHYIETALELTGQRIGKVVRRSSVYETEPWGFHDPVNFMNLAAEVETHLDPKALLREIKQIERDMGREAHGRRFQSRIIDIDILMYDSLVYLEEDLILPHPQLPVRRFALVPLHEIAPGLVHPVLHQTIATLLDRCDDPGEVVLFRSRVTGYNNPSSAKL